MESDYTVDPMSGVTALYELASEIITLCLRHGHGVWYGMQEMRSFVDRIIQFQNVLCRLAKPMEDSTKDRNDRILHFRAAFGRQSSSVSTCLRDLEGSLQKLRIALVPGPALEQLHSSLTWPLGLSDLQRMDDRMRTVEEGIAKALTTDANLLPKSIGLHLRKPVGLSEELQRMQQEELRQLREIEKDDARRLSILSWLKHPDPFTSHNAACANRNDSINPGSWLIEGPEFQRFQTEKQGMLWLHGDAGTGKTVLSSLVVDHLRKVARNDASIAIAFWYFDGTDQSRTSADSLLRALICQIVGNPTVKIPRALTDLWISKLRGRRPPRVSELLAVLLKVLAEVKKLKVFIVLDALDEFNESDRETVLGLFRSVLSDAFGCVHIFASSRLRDDLRVEFLRLPHLQSLPISDRAASDIAAHAKHIVRTDRVLNHWPREELERIENALVRNTGGVFQLVNCLLREIRTCKRLSDLDQTLQSLPKDLNEQFNRESSRVKDSEANDALRLVECMAFAQRPLNMAEISDMLAVDLDHDPPYFDAGKRMLNPTESLDACQSLFQPTSSDNWHNHLGAVTSAETFTFANKTVLDFIKSQPIRFGSQDAQELSIGPGNFLMAEICLVYLQHLCTMRFSSPQALLEQYPFARYCTRFWNQHYSAALRDRGDWNFSHLNKTIIDIFNDQDKLLAYVQLSAADDGKSEEVSSISAATVQGPLYYAALLGLKDVAQYFLSEGANVNKSRRSGYGTPLIAAVANCHMEIVRILLQEGADPTLPSEEYGYPLAVAIEQDDYEIVNLLMHQKGVDVDCQRMPPQMIAERKASAVQRQLDMSDGQDDPEQVPYPNNSEASRFVEFINEAKAREGMVYVAVEHRAIRALNLLLDTGADPNIEGGSCHTALILACAQGDDIVVDALLQHEAQMDVCGGILGSAVGAACLNGGNSGLLKKVLAYEVDVNTPLDTGETPLCIAAKNNDMESIDLLLKYGADARTNQQRPVSPLEIAARSGYVDIAEKLLDAGADSNLPGIEYSTVLHAACLSPNINMVRLLLDRGADVNYMPDNSHATPLQFAASNGREDVVDLLLVNGANIMAPIGRFGNSMQAAVAGQNLAILEKFRNSGISVNLRGGPFTYPLFRALEIPSYHVVEWLLDHGADVRARNEDESPYSRYRPTALHMCRDVSLARLLVERGAEVNIATAESVPPLKLAAEIGNVPMAKFLIEHGADPNGASPEDGSTALISASRGGYTDLAELLIQNGADVHHRNACGLNAMTVAVQTRRLEILGVLFLHGAKGPTAVDARGVSDLHYAAASGKLDAIDYIVQSCSQDPNIRDANGWTALHWATKSPWGSVKMIKKLLGLGVDNHLRDTQGRTALDIAVSLGMKNEAKVLRARTKQDAEEVHDMTDIDYDDPVGTWWGYDTCNACGSGRGDQYQCQQCPHYNLCFRCVLDQKNVHMNGHELLCVLHDGDGFDHLQQNRDLDGTPTSNNNDGQVVKSKVMPRLKTTSLRTSSLRVSDAPLTSPSTPLELRWLDQRFRPDSHFSDGRVNSNNFEPPPVPRKDSYLLPSPRVKDLRSSNEPKDLMRVSTGTSQSEYSETSEDGKALESKFDIIESGPQQVAPSITAYGPRDRAGNLEEIDPEEQTETSFGPFYLRDDTSPRTTVGHLSAMPSGKSDVSRVSQFPHSPASLDPLYSPRTIPPTSDGLQRAASKAAEDAPIPSHTTFLRPPSQHEDWLSRTSAHESSEQKTEALESQERETATGTPMPLPKDSPPRLAAQPAGELPSVAQQSAQPDPRALPPGLLVGRPGVAKGLQPPTTSNQDAPAHAWENRRYSRISIPPPPPPKPGKPAVPPPLPTAPAAEGRFPLHMYSVSAGTPAPLYSGNIGAAAGTPIPPPLLPQASTPSLPSQITQSTSPLNVPPSLQSATVPPRSAQQLPSPPPAPFQHRLPPFAPRPVETSQQQAGFFSKAPGPSSPHHGHSASVSKLPGPPDNPSQPRTLAQMTQQQAMQYHPPRQSSLDKNGQPIPPAPTLSQLKQQEAISFPQQPSRHSIGGLEGNPDFIPSPLSSGPTPLTGPLPPFSAGFGPSPLSGPPTSRRGHSPHASESGWRPSPFGEPDSYFPPRPAQTSEPRFPPRPSDASDVNYQQRPSEASQVSNVSFQQRPSEASQISNVSYQQRPSEASQISSVSYQHRPSEASQVSNMSYQPRPSQGSESHFSPRPSQGSESHFAPRPSQGSELHLPPRPSVSSEAQTPRRPPMKPSEDSDSSSGSGSLGMVALPAEVSLGYGPDFSFDSSKSAAKKPSNEVNEKSIGKEPQELQGDDRNILQEGQKGRGNAWMADNKRAGHMKQASRQERPADITTMRTGESTMQHEKPQPEPEPPREKESTPLRSPDARKRAAPSALEPSTPPQPMRSANAGGGMAARLTAAAARAGTIAHAAAAAAAVRQANGPESPRTGSPSTSGKDTPPRPSPPPASGKLPRNRAPSINAPPAGRVGSPFDAAFDGSTGAANRNPSDAGMPFSGGSVVTTITGGQQKRGIWSGRDGMGRSGSGSGRGRGDQTKASPRMHQSPRIPQGSGEGMSKGSPRLQQQPQDPKAVERAKWERGRVDYDRLYGGESDEGF